MTERDRTGNGVVELDLTRPPQLPRQYRNDLRLLRNVTLGKIVFNPSKLRIRRVRSPAYWTGARYASGDQLLSVARGKRTICAHMHNFYVRYPEKVPHEVRGYVVHSPATLWEGHRGAIYVLGFYFVDSKIREDVFLVTGEVAETALEHYQVIGLHSAMPRTT